MFDKKPEEDKLEAHPDNEAYTTGDMNAKIRMDTYNRATQSIEILKRVKEKVPSSATTCDIITGLLKKTCKALMDGNDDEAESTTGMIEQYGMILAMEVASARMNDRGTGDWADSHRFK